MFPSYGAAQFSACGPTMRVVESMLTGVSLPRPGSHVADELPDAVAELLDRGLEREVDHAANPSICTCITWSGSTVTTTPGAGPGSGYRLPV
jgi:hypothetical protein